MLEELHLVVEKLVELHLAVVNLAELHLAVGQKKHQTSGPDYSLNRVKKSKVQNDLLKPDEI